LPGGGGALGPDGRHPRHARRRAHPHARRRKPQPAAVGDRARVRTAQATSRARRRRRHAPAAAAPARRSRGARGGTERVDAGAGRAIHVADCAVLRGRPQRPEPGPHARVDRARAVRHGQRVVVSTDTRTLQEQLMSKDLPGLREWLPWDFKACLLKGRSNYVSLRRWRRYLAEPCHDADELRFKLKVLVWLHSTESGDRSELRLHGREEVFWACIASDPLDCVGIHCTKEDCYVHRARAEAEAADIVVVNHALLLADAEIGGGLLPEFEHLVIDEAHHLEEAATRGLRQEVDGPGLQALLERLGGEGQSSPSAGVPALQAREVGPGM